MTIGHHLRGYDRQTELLRAEHNIAASLLPAVRELVGAPTDDPELLQPHALDLARATELATWLGVRPDLSSLDFFVEADEDRRIVAAKRDAMRATS